LISAQDKEQLTQLLKKRNNQVVGLDVSSTAAEMAKARFPDIEFDVVDVNDVGKIHEYCANRS